MRDYTKRVCRFPRRWRDWRRVAIELERLGHQSTGYREIDACCFRRCWYEPVGQEFCGRGMGLEIAGDRVTEEVVVDKEILAEAVECLCQPEPGSP